MEQLNSMLASQPPSTRDEMVMMIEMESSQKLNLVEVEERAAADLKVLIETHGMQVDDVEALWDLVGVGGNQVGAKNANVDALRAMLDRFELPVDIGLGRGLQENLLHEACDNDLVGIVRFLLERGADLSRTNFSGDTPFTGAARHSRAGVIQAFCSYLPASTLAELINAKTKTGFDPLSLCINALRREGQPTGVPDRAEPASLTVFKCLVDAGADLNARSKSGSSIVAKLARDPHPGEDDNEASERALRYLLEQSARRGEVDFATTMRVDGEAESSVVAYAIGNPNAEARRIVLSAAASRERAKPGSGDPHNLLQLRAGGPTDPRSLARGMAGMGLGGMMGGMMGGGYVPRSDGFADACVACGESTSSRCSGCSHARFCSRQCQLDGWPSHKKQCASLRKKLPSRVQVLRHRNGAEIADAGALVPSDAACVGEGATPPKSVLVCGEEWDASELSGCALAHASVLRALTPEQMEARYTPACAERWGKGPMGDAKHRVGGKVGVPLRALLGGSQGEVFEGCDDCGGDGAQWFSFCLNRPVNDNLVEHCDYCGRCFYNRHGTRRCAHCKCMDLSSFFGDFAEGGNSAAEKWKVERADSFERGLAAEGYWGF